MSKKATAIKDKESLEPKFETALSRLEKIVEEMEAGELSLEDSLKRYEEGIGLARFCSGKLNEVQKKIELIKKDAGGAWTRKSFDASEEN